MPRRRTGAIAIGVGNESGRSSHSSPLSRFLKGPIEE
jgi:hypothetical protein